VKHWIRLRQHQGAIEVEAEDKRGFGLGHEIGKAPSMPKTAGSAKSSLIAKPSFGWRSLAGSLRKRNVTDLLQALRTRLERSKA
jgi:hypothetical protein